MACWTDPHETLRRSAATALRGKLPRHPVPGGRVGLLASLLQPVDAGPTGVALAPVAGQLVQVAHGADLTPGRCAATALRGKLPRHPVPGGRVGLLASLLQPGDAGPTGVALAPVAGQLVQVAGAPALRCNWK